MIKKWLKLLKKDERGLTLVELLAVIVILAIVGGIAFVVIGNVIDNSRADAHVSNAVQVINGAELSEVSGDGISDDSTDPTSASTIENLGDLIDPWGEDDNYDFEVYKTEDGQILISSGHSNCSFDDLTKENLNRDGREVCGNDYDPEN